MADAHGRERANPSFSALCAARDSTLFSANRVYRLVKTASRRRGKKERKAENEPRVTDSLREVSHTGSSMLREKIVCCICLASDDPREVARGTDRVRPWNRVERQTNFRRLCVSSATQLRRLKKNRRKRRRTRKNLKRGAWLRAEGDGYGSTRLSNTDFRYHSRIS